MERAEDGRKVEEEEREVGDTHAIVVVEWPRAMADASLILMARFVFQLLCEKKGLRRDAHNFTT